MKTLVGLYKDVATANQVVQAIVGYGIARDAIRRVDRNERSLSEPDSLAVDRLFGTLTEAGVPAEEASAYVEGVQHGGTLITVQTHDDQANNVVHSMHQYAPIDVGARAGTWYGEVEPADPDLTGTDNELSIEDSPINQAGAALSPEAMRAHIQRIAEPLGVMSRTDYDHDGKSSYYTDGSQDEKERKSLEKRSPLNTRTNVGEQPGEYNEELRPLSRDRTEAD